MHMLIFFLLFIFASISFAFAVTDTLPERSSLSVEKPSETLVSANGDFSAGFFQVGNNAFCFSVWFTRSKPPTVTWMANRDEPVNGKGSKLSLWKNGNLVLIDAERTTIWTTGTCSPFESHLKLLNNGNLILLTSQSTIVWQSFDSPTDTLLPGQAVTEQASLVSSRSTTNYSSGFYKLYFDNDNVLRLLYKGATLSSVYWPETWKLPIDNGRSTYNVSKTAVLDSFGQFSSSDGFTIRSADYPRIVHRRLKMDPDGNLRVYSFNEEHEIWEVSWQVISQPCTVHGICGANSLCTYHPVLGRTCYCLQGFKVKDPNDWTQGCEPEFSPSYFSCNRKESMDFLHLKTTELFGYDFNVTAVTSLKECQNLCLELCDKCRGVQFKFNGINTYNCYPKTILLNGRDSPNFDGEMYLKLPKVTLLSSSEPLKHSFMNCSVGLSQRLDRFYQLPRRNSTLSFLVWFACGIGAFEVSSIFLVWFFLFRTNKQPDKMDQQQHLLSATGFQRFAYAELKSATNGFREEVGRGAGGIVYKGTLCDQRVAAIKRLSEANQGEAEFLAEISTIGMLNHMNLIDMWGYCVEGKHRLLVYEYMEHGSLANNLFANALDWKKRFNVAVGTAKGLAYLHEECLEWILHCDVKPQNILLDSEFQPKVADFGLSKLLNRDERGSSNFSRIRGTRGYMAPEWVYNLRITSKVDVYSYGIVVLEMVTGRSPMEIHSLENSKGIEQRRLVTWVTDKINIAPTSEFWIEEIADPNLEGQYNVSEVEILVKVALQCVKDDMNERPTMSQVAEMLQSHERK
ncbi:putative receptor protein kinase ZmPK1 [Abrus precatorius]|uniref:Receptor-like serine/threonine-protein kinase n=1 Tax=Abrus precatorius TaxID=3816 RepID=A0A8B8LJG3_ABRPR|nr:putative receptor protein kinase ZmPK1 [Abrus precatorius]